jgi:hypothetical protein
MTYRSLSVLRRGFKGEAQDQSSVGICPCRAGEKIFMTGTPDPERRCKMEEEKAEGMEREEVDALCPECGHGFKAFVDRIVDGMQKSEMQEKIACPVCGCGECDVVRHGSS